MAVLAFDPGTARIGCALVNKGKLLATVTYRKVPATQSDCEAVAKAAQLLLVKHDIKKKDLHVVAEAPAPRYYGRSNATALLRLWWQAWFILHYFMKKAKVVHMVNSYDWNVGTERKQQSDDDKLALFKSTFPGKTTGNKDTRDAALMAYWYEQKLAA